MVLFSKSLLKVIFHAYNNPRDIIQQNQYFHIISYTAQILYSELRSFMHFV